MANKVAEMTDQNWTLFRPSAPDGVVVCVVLKLASDERLGILSVLLTSVQVHVIKVVDGLVELDDKGVDVLLLLEAFDVVGLVRGVVGLVSRRDVLSVVEAVVGALVVVVREGVGALVVVDLLGSVRVAGLVVLVGPRVVVVLGVVGLVTVPLLRT